MRFNDKIKSQLPYGLFIDESVATLTLRVITFRWIPASACLMESRWLNIDPNVAVGVEITADDSLMIPNYEAVVIHVPIVYDINAVRLGQAAVWRGQFWVYQRFISPQSTVLLRMLGNHPRIE